MRRSGKRSRDSWRRVKPISSRTFESNATAHLNMKTEILEPTFAPYRHQRSRRVLANGLPLVAGLLPHGNLAVRPNATL
jgi:hypothetical protein